MTDLSLRRPVNGRLELLLSVENLFDEKVVTGRLPVEALGAGRLVQVGVRINGWGAKAQVTQAR